MTLHSLIHALIVIFIGICTHCSYSDVIVQPSHPKPIHNASWGYTPDLSRQTSEESQYLKLHKCFDVGEAYGAAYLITKAYLISKDIDRDLSSVNCEAGSMIIMNHNTDPQQTDQPGLLIQSIDVLDYSMVHLSAYERSMRRYSKDVSRITNKPPIVDDLSEIEKTASLMKERALTIHALENSISDDFKQTLVIMPFLGDVMGDGNSKPVNRFIYLHACFWSLYSFTTNIIVFVMNKNDYDYIKLKSSLPFYDVILLNNLPTTSALPVASVHYTKARLIDQSWKFEYIFFTESDQLLMLRIPNVLYDHLRRYPTRALTPHRLWPFSENTLLYALNRTLDLSQGPYDWTKMSCCLPRQNCQEPTGKKYRRTWITPDSPAVPIVNVYGLWVTLGNSNFRKQIYRPCKMHEGHKLEYCP